MVTIYKLTRGQIGRRRNAVGHSPKCDCGCGHEFKVGDIVHSTRTGRGGGPTWRLPMCMDRLRTL